MCTRNLNNPDFGIDLRSFALYITVIIASTISGDLFPSLDVPRKRDMDFEKKIRKSIVSLKLQPEESFVLKVSSINAHSEPVGAKHKIRR